MSQARISDAHRRIVIERAHGLCEYCLSPLRVSTNSFSIEHIWPRAKGGVNNLENLALACQGCNNHKHAKTTAIDPVSSMAVNLYHPRQDPWHNHFVWSADGIYLLGLTATGRATIATLQLNRSNVLNLRQLLVMAGQHPPTW